MNEELHNKIKEAIINNDTAALERLSKEHGVIIRQKAPDNRNELSIKIKEAIANNDTATLERLEKEHGIQIKRLDQKSTTNNIEDKSFMIKKEVSINDYFDKENITYFRDIPCNNDLFIIYTLASDQKLLEHESDLIGAFILRWINNGKVEFKTIEKGLFKRKRLVISFKNDLSFEDEMEKNLYEYVRKISNNNVLKDNNFYKWLKKNRFRFNSFLSEIKFDALKKLEDEGLIKINDIDIEHDKFVSTPTKLYDVKFSRTTNSTILPKYFEYSKQIIGFKKFIKEFSILSEKEIIEVNLWQDYLVIAELLGVADYIKDRFEEVIPNFELKSKIKLKPDEVDEVVDELIEKYKDMN